MRQTTDMEQNAHLAPRVLLAIDDIRLRRTNEAGLRSAGFAVSAPGDADAVSILAESFSPDVLVVDTDMSGPGNQPLYRHLRGETDSYLLCKLDQADDSLRVVHTVRGVGFRISNEILDLAELGNSGGTMSYIRPEVTAAEPVDPRTA